MAIQLMNLSEQLTPYQHENGDEKASVSSFKQYFDYITQFSGYNDMLEYCAPLAQAADYNLSLKEADK